MSEGSRPLRNSVRPLETPRDIPDTRVAGQRLAVDGSITGNVTARDSLELAANAKIEGDLITAKLVVTEGATFVGYCRVGPEASKAMANGQTASRPRTASASEPKPAAKPEPVKA